MNIAGIRRMLFWAADIMAGGRLWTAYRDVRRMNMHPGRAAQARPRMLKGIMEFAKASTDFYTSVVGTELKDFPVINKAVIRAGYDAFQVTADRIPGRRGDRIVTHHTSGSTGIPFHVFQDKPCHIRSIATLKYYNDLIGYHSCEPMMKISMLEVLGQHDFSTVHNRRDNIWFVNVVSLDKATLQALVDKINAEGIRFIRAYMTIIDDLTAYVVSSGQKLKSSPTFISIGELLTEPLRLRVVETMGLHIVSQYANEENGVLGQAEPDAPGDLVKVNRANHVIEILKLDSDEPAAPGEAGRVVVTDLCNRAMPLIRYDIGDVAAAVETAPDGSPLTLRLMACRTCDILYRTDGSTGSLAIPADLWAVKGVRQLQFEQTGLKEYVLHVNTSCPGAFGSRETDLLRDHFGSDARIEIDYMDGPPEVNARKRKLMVQSCKEYKKTL